MSELEKITKKEASKLFLKDIKDAFYGGILTSAYSGACFWMGLAGTDKILDYGELLGMPVRVWILGCAGGWGLVSGLGFKAIWNDLKDYTTNPEEYVQKYYNKKLE